MQHLRPLTIFLAGVASGLVSAGAVSVALDGKFGFYYASAGGLLLVIAGAMVVRDLRPDDSDAVPASGTTTDEPQP